MVELVWQAAPGTAAGTLAEYRVSGARVKIMASEGATPEGEVPEWVRVAQELMLRRFREYREAAGHLPSRELVDAFQAEMGARLEAFLQDPRGHPFQPMGLWEFEQKRKEEQHGRTESEGTEGPSGVH